MTVSLSVSWDDAKKKRGVVLFVALLLLALPLQVRGADRRPAAGIIVEAVGGRIDDARRAVLDAGGTVTADLGIIGGFAADVPGDAVDELRAAAAIASVTVDADVKLNGVTDGFDAQADSGSMYTTDRVVGARAAWWRGLTGDGVDVALVDSGIVPVDGLRAPGKVVDGPDFSSEAGSDAVRDLDTFGHGTHMAGIIAGRDDSVDDAASRRDSESFVGVAPDARLVSVKVANALGATDVSRVVAGIGWVVAHRHDDGLNIRVLNLSFGAVAYGSPSFDPLVRAVDTAWANGIVVVVSAGNRGASSDGVDTPARSTNVITVGADDPRGTVDTDDDVIPAFSSSGDGTRNPDLVAPGRSIVSLRDPASYIDQQNPSARVGTHLFRGSGTSAATAVVSGTAALLLEQRPDLTPDQVKALLVSTASPVPNAGAERQGAGLVNLRAAVDAATPDVPSASISTSTRWLGDSPSLSVTASNPGNTWDGNSWSGNSWSCGGWAGNSWSGNSWSMVEADGP